MIEKAYKILFFSEWFKESCVIDRRVILIKWNDGSYSTAIQEKDKFMSIHGEKVFNSLNDSISSIAERAKEHNVTIIQI